MKTKEKKGSEKATNPKPLPAPSGKGCGLFEQMLASVVSNVPPAELASALAELHHAVSHAMIRRGFKPPESVFKVYRYDVIETFAQRDHALRMALRKASKYLIGTPLQEEVLSVLAATSDPVALPPAKASAGDVNVYPVETAREASSASAPTKLEGGIRAARAAIRASKAAGFFA